MILFLSLVHSYLKLCKLPGKLCKVEVRIEVRGHHLLDVSWVILPHVVLLSAILQATHVTTT
ncbi:hypothetical protein D3C86_2234390 [compost metagenome]